MVNQVLLARECLGATLHQDGHVLAFESQRLKDAEIHLSIYKKQMLHVTRALTIWKHYPIGAHFMVNTDHQSLWHRLTQTKLSEKHLRWANFMSMFSFQIIHTPRTQNKVVDDVGMGNPTSLRPHMRSASGS